MIVIVLGIFVILHGLVHLWYFVLSQGLVEYQPEMGWIASDSLILSSILKDTVIEFIAGALYILSTISFVIAGISYMNKYDWWRVSLIGSAIFSSLVIILFWDGSLDKVVQKGLFGLIINIVIIALARMK